MTTLPLPPQGPICLTTKLGRYIEQTTQDGQPTLWSEAYGESCHSSDGAGEETLYHYLQGTFTLARAALRPLHILEIGLGTGLGFELTARALADSPHPYTFSVVEIDPELAEWTCRQRLGLAWNSRLIRWQSAAGQWWQWHLGANTLNVLIGDARRTLVALEQELFAKLLVDAIYQDAFSPKRNPTLWTHEWFSQLYKISAPDCWMGTYSASTRPRKSMQAAGWQVFNAPGHGRKRACTRACKGLSTHVLPESWEDITHALTQSKSIALSDKELAQQNIPV